MSPTLQELKDAASNLTVGGRAELAQFLLRSLDDEEEGAREAWLALAEQRLVEIRAGKFIGVPAEEVLKNLLGPRR
jgi:putative addiction module component (TIGR02574 family)